jgi:hypothetical protein
MTRRWLVMAFALLMFFASDVAQAKRDAPKEVKPVTLDGIRYVVSHWGSDNGSKQNGGFLQAWDVKTNKKLWTIRVYDVKYAPGLEQDVQGNFIVSLEVVDGKLRVVNEAKDVFDVDPRTKEVFEVGRRTGKIKLVK